MKIKISQIKSDIQREKVGLGGGARLGSAARVGSIPSRWQAGEFCRASDPTSGLWDLLGPL